jgi:hydrogenase/urease accessory protein HupE
MRRVLLVALLLVAASSGAFAHEVRPAYLELRQTAATTYDVLWKVPARGENMRLVLDLVLPDTCAHTSRTRAGFVDLAFIERFSVTCNGGLTGGTIRVGGLSATVIDVLVRLERLDGATVVHRLTADRSSFVVEAAPGTLEVARTYLVLGVQHILLGVDHLLFVLAVLILVKGGRRLVGTITAFTVAHSISLAAATLGFVRDAGPPVEAVIALSIVFIACEIVRRRQGDPGLTERSPWLVAFIFGLLHGLGFAGALHEVGLPQHAIPLALMLFNVGVEIGQLLFIASVMALLALARVVDRQLRARLRTPTPQFAAWDVAAAYAIGSVAAFWLIERTLACV